MQRFNRFLTLSGLAVFILLASGLAFAQEVVPVEFDLSGIFTTTAALAGAVMSITAFLKKNVFKAAEGLVVIIISLVTGALLGLLGGYLGFIEGTFVSTVGFGLSAGLLASGGWDAISGLIKQRGE